MKTLIPPELGTRRGSRVVTGLGIDGLGRDFVKFVCDCGNGEDRILLLSWNQNLSTRCRYCPPEMSDAQIEKLRENHHRVDRVGEVIGYHTIIGHRLVGHRSYFTIQCKHCEKIRETPRLDRTDPPYCECQPRRKLKTVLVGDEELTLPQIAERAGLTMRQLYRLRAMDWTAEKILSRKAKKIAGQGLNR